MNKLCFANTHCPDGFVNCGRAFETVRYIRDASVVGMRTDKRGNVANRAYGVGAIECPTYETETINTTLYLSAYPFLEASPAPHRLLAMR